MMPWAFSPFPSDGVPATGEMRHLAANALSLHVTGHTIAHSAQIFPLGPTRKPFRVSIAPFCSSSLAMRGMDRGRAWACQFLRACGANSVNLDTYTRTFYESTSTAGRPGNRTASQHTHPPSRTSCQTARRDCPPPPPAPCPDALNTKRGPNAGNLQTKLYSYFLSLHLQTDLPPCKALQRQSSLRHATNCPSSTYTTTTSSTACHPALTLGRACHTAPRSSEKPWPDSDPYLSSVALHIASPPTLLHAFPHSAFSTLACLCPCTRHDGDQWRLYAQHARCAIWRPDETDQKD